MQEWLLVVGGRGRAIRMGMGGMTSACGTELSDRPGG